MFILAASSSHRPFDIFCGMWQAAECVVFSASILDEWRSTGFRHCLREFGSCFDTSCRVNQGRVIASRLCDAIKAWGSQITLFKHTSVLSRNSPSWTLSLTLSLMPGNWALRYLLNEWVGHIITHMSRVVSLTCNITFNVINLSTSWWEGAEKWGWQGPKLPLLIFK